MGGSGGGGIFNYRTPAEVAKQVKSTVEETAVREFDTQLGELLGKKLATANSRDVPKVADRLNEIKSLLSEELESSVDTLFGGSVARHTYVDGLSDIDSLLILGDEFANFSPPSKLIKLIAEQIRSADDDVGVRTGRLAVTITYKDGMEIQLLPATKIDGQLRVPSFLEDTWSDISPEKFQKALTARNGECGGKLIPTIKLAKAINGTLPEQQRLSGYHIESLAIAAFKDYQGPKTTSAMLPTLFEKARDLVSKPISDSSGQSVHVDAYLGAAGSAARVAASHVAGRIAKRMRNASAQQSAEMWESLFGDI